MAVTVVATLKVKPGLADTVLEAMTAMLPETRAYAGCLGVDVVEGVDDPNTILLLEEWETPESQQAYLQWRAESGALTQMAEVLAEPPTFVHYAQRRDVHWG